MGYSLDFFKELSKVPRPSKHEEQARAFLIKKAENLGYAHKTDEAGNLLISVPGSGAKAKDEPLALQAHMDMVCEKNEGVQFDFMRDPLQLYEENGFLKAKGTTLGADNGIGIALAFYCATFENRPPLEIVLTVDEEQGMSGAAALKKGFFKSRRLLNLDSEEEGVFTTGAAGGAHAEFRVPIERDAGYKAAYALNVKISGLKGGHSGAEIHLNRLSASKIAVEVLKRWQEREFDFRLVSMQAGAAANAIAREAQFVALFASEGDGKAAQAMSYAFEHGPDDKLKIEAMPVETGQQACTAAVTAHLAVLLDEIPHGVLAWSEDWPDAVETSCNLANVRTAEKAFDIIASYRSFSDSKLAAMSQDMKKLAVNGIECRIASEYPAWPPAKENPLLDVTLEVYRALFNKEPKAGPIHAGLECGYLEKAGDNLRAVSLGPTMHDNHSPDERLELASLERTEKLLAAIIAKI